jgi:hypothetical protein
MADLHAWWEQDGNQFRGYIAVGETKVWRSSHRFGSSREAERAATETMARGLGDLFSRFEVID